MNNLFFQILFTIPMVTALIFAALAILGGETGAGPVSLVALAISCMAMVRTFEGRDDD